MVVTQLTSLVNQEEYLRQDALVCASFEYTISTNTSVLSFIGNSTREASARIRLGCETPSDVTTVDLCQLNDIDWLS